MQILAMMSESMGEAQQLESVVPTVYRWHLRNGLGVDSCAHAVMDIDRSVLIDPLWLRESELVKLEKISAVVLTGAAGQRAGWRFRRAFGAPIYAPEGVRGLEEEPDMLYSSGEALPGGLVAFHTPGPTGATHVLWLTTSPRGVVFLADLLWHDGTGVPRFGDARHQEDAARSRTSVRRIVERLPVEVLCFNYGPPVIHNGIQALREALALDDKLSKDETGMHVS